MARDTHVLKDFEARLRDAGGTFMRMTGKGYRRWHLKNGKQVVIVDLPTKGYEFGHQKKNVEAEIKRALKACGRFVREEPKRKEEAKREVTPPVRPVPQPVESDRVPDVHGDVDGNVAIDEPRGEAGDVQGVAIEDGPRVPDESPEPSGLAEPLPPVAGHAGPFACDVCGETFLRPMGLGRHRQARHGIAGLHRAKPAKVADGLAAKVAPDSTIAERQSGPGWRFAEAPARPVLTGPPPLGMTRPTATLVAGTATMEKVAALAEALAAAARDLVTEYRLVREENTRLTEAVQQMERMFEGLRRR